MLYAFVSPANWFPSKTVKGWLGYHPPFGFPGSPGTGGGPLFRKNRMVCSSNVFMRPVFVFFSTALSTELSMEVASSHSRMRTHTPWGGTVRHTTPFSDLEPLRRRCNWWPMGTQDVCHLSPITRYYTALNFDRDSPMPASC